jgi:undecaprenyl-diphosphatase
MMPPDAGLTRWLTEHAASASAPDGVMRLLVGDLFIPACCALVVFALWFGARAREQRERNQRGVLAALAGFGFTTWLIWILNHWIGINPWPRPFIAYPDSAGVAAAKLFYFPVDPSFPSNGAAVLAAVATAIWFVNRKAGGLLYFLTFLWCFARLYCGIHYLTDLVVGVLIGIIISFLVFKLLFPRIEPILGWFFKTARKLYLA